jgi:hypothetical protein
MCCGHYATGLMWQCSSITGCLTLNHDTMKMLPVTHIRPAKLSRNEFAAICSEFSIEPALALECDAVIRALKTGEPDAVRLALACEF